jgi:hypothetical protein
MTITLSKADIKKVNDAHSEIERREKGTLKFALDAGELLAKAHASKDKDDKWDDWLADTFPKIKPSTDRLYRQLYAGKPELEKLAGGANALAEWSIRRARSELSPGGGGGTSAPTKETKLKKLVPTMTAEAIATILKEKLNPADRREVGRIIEEPSDQTEAEPDDNLVDKAKEIICQLAKPQLSEIAQYAINRIKEFGEGDDLPQAAE